jgi:hypothetical protein
LAHDAARGVQQTPIGLLQFLVVDQAFGTGDPGDLQHSKLHTAAAIAQLDPDLAGNLGDLLHSAGQDTHPIR